MVRLATLTCVALVLFGCGSEEAPAPVETPAPTPEATPEPTPEPTPEELDPVQVFHLVLDESVSAPPTPSRSPLARDQGPPPTGLPNAAFLEADRGSRGAVEGIQALQDGYGAPGQAVVLVEWNIRWGKDGTAGQARRWGLCGLPCTLEDGFVATPGHHPVDPLTQPRPLFAHRPGAADLLIEQDGDDLRVRTGDRTLWEAGSSMDAVGGTAAVVVPSINADGQLGPELEWTAARVLTALMVTSQPIELTSRVEPVPGTVRLLPRIGAKPDTPRQRAVEAVEEVWVWADAGRFEGGFTVKPDPAASGLRLDRAGERIRWTPTTGQAGREVEFATYTLGRSARSVTVQPFPDGAVARELGTHAGLEICAGETDVWAFTGEGQLSVTVEPAEDAGDLDLTVLDAAGEVLGESAHAEGQSEKVTVDLGAGMTVFVEVFGYSDATGAYTLTLATE